jgi:hypothetical protein
MSTAEVRAIGFDAVSDDPAPAVFATGSQGLNRALEAVEDVRFARLRDRERLVVVVAANFTSRHDGPPLPRV